MIYTILIVDDNEAHRYALARSLGAAGFAITPARNGNEALALAAQEHPDLVLLDIHLPDVSGFEVCRRLKAEPQTSRIPVAIHTASEAASAAVAAKDAGADAFLTYPVEPVHLLSVIHGCLARATAAAGA